MAEGTSDARLADLERRVGELERTAVGLAGPEGPGQEPDEPDEPGERFWVLAGLREQLRGHPGGGVVFAGSVQVADGRAEWQQGALTDDLMDTDWDRQAASIAALGHPLRCRLLQAVLAGTHAAADLSGLPGIGTSGQVYHHLRALTAAGWLRGGVRGTWRVPPERVVPLLVLLAAARG